MRCIQWDFCSSGHPKESKACKDTSGIDIDTAHCSQGWGSDSKGAGICCRKRCDFRTGCSRDFLGIASTGWKPPLGHLEKGTKGAIQLDAFKVFNGFEKCINLPQLWGSIEFGWFDPSWI
jgi:hypothetical protein